MTEPETRLTLEAPAGLIEVKAQCRAGKAEEITLTNVPSFADRLQVPLEVAGMTALTVDTAFGGDSFVLADAGKLGFAITADEARDMAVIGRKIAAAANEQIGFRHPELEGWDHISFCFLTGPLERQDETLTSRNACVVNPGKIDRSPTGTGCSALMAVLHAKGLLRVGEPYIGRSLIESRFTGRIEAETAIASQPAIVPSITGRAWVTGMSTLLVDPDDPWPQGYKIADTWPRI
jgi:trans-L-3-hydroxyproline dehydratase